MLEKAPTKNKKETKIKESIKNKGKKRFQSPNTPWGAEAARSGSQLPAAIYPLRAEGRVDARKCMSVHVRKNGPKSFQRGASRGGQKTSQKLEVARSNCQRLLSPGEQKNYQKIVPWEPKIVPKGVVETPLGGPKGLRRRLREGAAKQARSRTLQKQQFCDFWGFQIRFSNF